MENSRLHETQNPEKNNNKKVAATTVITRTISQRKKRQQYSSLNIWHDIIKLQN